MAPPTLTGAGTALSSVNKEYHGIFTELDDGILWNQCARADIPQRKHCPCEHRGPNVFTGLQQPKFHREGPRMGFGPGYHAADISCEHPAGDGVVNVTSTLTPS